MIPKEQKETVVTDMGDFTGPAPALDLGKKLSVPQDLMIEELSLRNNRGSLLFQKRQRRVQRFTFELTASQQAILAGSARGPGAGAAEPASEPGQVANGPAGQRYRSELRVLPASPGAPEDAGPASAGAPRGRSPSALAPGYAEPLKSVPPEKFNHTAIPKGYRCPWRDAVGYADHAWDGPRSHTPHVAGRRDFNKTPVPFGGPLVGEAIPRAGTPFVPEPFNGLELLRLRPNFNRVAQGWTRNLPESEEL